MYTADEKKQLEKLAKGILPRSLEKIHLNTAGIDISPKIHAVAVPEGRDPAGQNVRQFGPTTPELKAIAQWLRECGVESVAMESTGVYWVPMFEILEACGFEVILVHANAFRNVPGKKTDIQDCQWLQTLHTYGLLRGCFRPAEDILSLRSYSRERQDLIEMRSSQVQKMQKALDQMNVLVHRAVSDITGLTGMNIIRAIVGGESDPKKLATFRNRRCHKSEQKIEEALSGNFLERHLFSLKIALEQYDHLQGLIQVCELKMEESFIQQMPNALAEPPADEIEARLVKFRPRKGDPHFNLPLLAKKMLGVDCTAIDGISIRTMMTFVCEVGYDLSPWKTAEHFTSWLALCPGNHKTGGVQRSGRTRKSSNRLAQAFRNAANTLHKNKGPLGVYLRKMKATLGKAKAITATAHKLARVVYVMIKEGKEYDSELLKNQNPKQQRSSLKGLKRWAAEMGYELVPQAATESC